MHFVQLVLSSNHLAIFRLLAPNPKSLPSEPNPASQKPRASFIGLVELDVSDHGCFHPAALVSSPSDLVRMPTLANKAKGPALPESRTLIASSHQRKSLNGHTSTESSLHHRYVKISELRSSPFLHTDPQSNSYTAASTGSVLQAL